MSSLSQMLVGQRGQVAQVVGDDSVTVRLMEMGLTPGAEIELIGTAPLGDPLEFQVRGYRLSLRKNQAARVKVTLFE